jgi:hypothetical protein
MSQRCAQSLQPSCRARPTPGSSWLYLHRHRPKYWEHNSSTRGRLDWCRQYWGLWQCRHDHDELDIGLVQGSTQGGSDITLLSIPDPLLVHAAGDKVSQLVSAHWDEVRTCTCSPSRRRSANESGRRVISNSPYALLAKRAPSSRHGCRHGSEQ